MESTARGNRKPEITKESAAAEKNHHNRQNAMRSCTLRETVVAHFCHSMSGFLLSQSQNRSASVTLSGQISDQTFWHRRCSRNIRSATSWYGRRSAARLEGSSCKKSGALVDTKGGKSNRAASFEWFRLQIKRRRARNRATPLEP